MNKSESDILLEFHSSYLMLEMLRDGVRCELLLNTADLIGISPQELCTLLKVPWVTIRHLGKDQKLPLRVGDHLLQIIFVVKRATAVLGSLDSTVKWLMSPILAIGCDTPISLMDTFTGIHVVLDTLGRIEQGVHS